MSNIFQWQLHGDGKTLQPGEVVEPDERLTWTRTAGIGWPYHGVNGFRNRKGRAWHT